MTGTPQLGAFVPGEQFRMPGAPQGPLAGLSAGNAASAVKRYAIWGRLVAGQPDQIGYSIIDAKSMGKFMPPVYPPIRAHFS